MAKKEIENKKETSTKKKPGPKKGTPSNNPFGRPLGSKNKVPNKVKELLENWSIDEFEGFKKDYKQMDPTERAKLYERVSSKFLPRPMNEEEAKANKDFGAELMRRMFGGKKKDEDNEE